MAKTWLIAAMLYANASFAAAAAQTTASDPLWQGFQSPPNAAKPRVWWHWMNGNVTKEGIRLDLEWMQRVGIGGVQNFEAGFEGWGAPFDTPQAVDQPLIYLSPEWQKVMRSTVDLADRLGLEFAVASSPGFSETGGPWVEPREGMKKLVWSETWVDGGRRFSGRLAHPPVVSGLFQNIPLNDFGPGVDRNNVPTWYADVATIAYRAPASERPPGESIPRVTTSSGTIDAARLRDGDLATTQSLPFGDGTNAWIQFSYPRPQRIQAATAVIGGPLLGIIPQMETREPSWLEASDDGIHFRKIIDLPVRGAPQQTVSFTPVTARIFRVVLERPKPDAYQQMGFKPEPTAHAISELVLHTGARVNRFEDKAGFSSRQILEDEGTPPITKEDAIRHTEIVDLTARVHPDGSLDWTPSSGRWRVLRLGYSLIARANHPAPRVGTGLEVDKLNQKYVHAYMDRYLGEFEHALGPERLGSHGLRYVVTDSYEAGAQNWTDDMLEQFQRRRGYDARPWLPVLLGRVVDSASASDRFLWDFRQTIGELIADAHYGQISRSLHTRGLGLYGESHEVERAFVGDGMAAKSTADIPMGAMWASQGSGTTQQGFEADVRESASVAHIYGQNLVAAESFTAAGNPYGFAPRDLKASADRMLALGVNRFVIHTSVHQPNSGPGPGIGLGPFGQWFTRRETWAEQAGAWVSYLSRSAYLLQQGRFVADIAYLYGEDTNLTSRFDASTPAIPQGYSFDYLNSEALLHELSVKDGRLVTDSGMTYRVLALDASTRQMSLPVARSIRDLVRAGAVVVGARPASTPSLADDEREFQDIVKEVWGDAATDHPLGSGYVYGTETLPKALSDLHIDPDMKIVSGDSHELQFVHRLLSDGDLYFVSNGLDRAQTADISFRVSGRAPELWQAVTGTRRPASYRMAESRTIISLALAAHEAVFIVFRQTTSAAERTTATDASLTLRAVLDGAWDVRFPPTRGAPTSVHLSKLQSWTENADPGVKYFSGTATYTRTLSLPRAWLKGERVQLDLGDVRDVAEVRVNGQSMGVLWMPPFTADITDALRPGENQVEINVTNLWPNRLIGDRQAGAQPIASAAFDPFIMDSPLRPSGLLGPVRILSAASPAH